MAKRSDIEAGIAGFRAKVEKRVAQSPLASVVSAFLVGGITFVYFRQIFPFVLLAGVGLYLYWYFSETE